MPYFLQKKLYSFDPEHIELSVAIFYGHPNIVIILFSMKLVATLVVAFLLVIASTYFVKKLVATKIHEFPPLDLLMISPMKSMLHW